MSDADMKIFQQTGANWSKTAYMLVYEKKLKSELRQIVREEGKVEENVENVSFNDVQKEIPEWIRDVVQKDNRAHIADN